MTDTAHLYQYHERDEERVVAAIAADPGISSAGPSEELGLPPDVIKRLTATLRAQGRAAFRSLPDEDGDLVVGWYPVPYDPSKAAPAPAPEAAPTPEVRTQCKYCGAEKETNVKRAGHERFCKLNPNRELAPGERKKAKVGPTRSADAEIPDCDGDTCRIGPLPPAEEFISDVKGAIDKCGGSLPWWDSYPGPRVLRFPDRAEYEEYLTRPPLPWTDLTVEQAYLDTFERKVREDLPLPRPAPGPCEPLNTCTPIDVQHVTIRTTERPEDEPTPLARICSLAVEMEALAARHGFALQVDIDTYVGTAPQMQARARRMGVSE